MGILMLHDAMHLLTMSGHPNWEREWAVCRVTQQKACQTTPRVQMRFARGAVNRKEPAATWARRGTRQ